MSWPGGTVLLFDVLAPDRDRPRPTGPAKDGPAPGRDLGLKHFAVLSDGTKIASPRFLRRAENKLPRAQRAQCRACGTWLDRDINAAVNVAKAAGLAVTACGAQVRPGLALAQRGEAATHLTSRRKAA